MSKKLAIILAINNIVLAWAIVWLNDGLANLAVRVGRTADLALRALSQARQNRFAFDDLYYYLDVVFQLLFG